MRIASVADVKARLSSYLKASKEELVVITRNGKPVAVLLPVEDEAEIERLVLAYSHQFQALLAEARQQIQAGGGTPHTAFLQEMEAETSSASREPPA